MTLAPLLTAIVAAACGAIFWGVIHAVRRNRGRSVYAPPAERRDERDTYQERLARLANEKDEER